MPDAGMSYASHGEDRVILGLLERRSWLPADGQVGYFVDVGAYHPYVASNSAIFYDLGWKVTAVEPNPFMADMWRAERPKAMVLQAAVNQDGSEAILYFFYDWASSNTLVKDFATAVAQGQGLAAPSEVAVKGVTLTDVFAAAPRSGPVHVLNVDVEGLDLEVLASNDWEINRPLVVCVEDLDLRLEDLNGSGTYRFLNSLGYELAAHAVLSSIYVDAGR